MKKYNLLALAACLWMTTACSDFLELNESGYNSVEYQFSTFDRTKAVATNVYGYLKDGYSEVCSTMIDAATDDAVNAWSTNGIKGFYDGSWNTSAPIGDVWEYYYRAIAAANYFIEHCPADFPAAKYQEKYEEKLKELKLYPYEIQALRAYFHFELLKRYKNIIIAYLVRRSHSLKRDRQKLRSLVTLPDNPVDSFSKCSRLQFIDFLQSKLPVGNNNILITFQ